MTRDREWLMLVKVAGRSLEGEGEVHRREGNDPTPTSLGDPKVPGFELMGTTFTWISIRTGRRKDHSA